MLLTSLDLLVIVFMVLIAVSLLALSLMFLVRNPRIKKICFFIVALLGIYTGYAGIRVGFGLFPVQMALGVVVVVASVASIVLAIVAKDDEKKSKIARFVAAGALIVGFFVAFMI